MKKTIPAILAFLLILGCSGEEQKVSLAVDNAYCPSGKAIDGTFPDILKIQNYRVIVSGDDIEPVEVILPGNTASAPIENIPKGENRTLLVEALNHRDQVICRRELTGLTIKGGKLIPVEIALLAVPFASNLSNGNVVTQTRLFFKGYGEPSGAVEILDAFNGTEKVLTDLDTSSDLVSPSIHDAGFSFKPVTLPIGEHTFTIRDSQTGEKSQVTVTLVRPGRFPGMGVHATGAINDSVIDTVGTAGMFPEVLETLTK